MKPRVETWHAFFAGIGLMALATSGYADDVNNKVVQPGQQFFGTSYNRLISEWTNWLVREPVATNPAFDLDGRYCGINQMGKVWFLASTFQGIADRTCEIPAGKALFISLRSFLSFAPDFPTPGDPCLQMSSDLERVRCDNNDDVDLAPNLKIEVYIDGVRVQDPFAYRTQSLPGGFTLQVPEPSLLTDFGFPSGPRFPSTADGYFLFIKPLDPGQHTINLVTTLPDQTQAGVNYTLTITE